MYLFYYKTTEGERSWRFAETKKSVENFIKEHKESFEEYGVTVTEWTYEAMEKQIDMGQKHMDEIKKALKEVIDMC